LLRKLIGKRTGIEGRGGVTGTFGLVDPWRDCLPSWPHRTVMKPLLNVFRKFNEIDLRNSSFSSKHDPVCFYTADRGVFVYLPADSFEVLSQRQ